MGKKGCYTSNVNDNLVMDKGKPFVRMGHKAIGSTCFLLQKSRLDSQLPQSRNLVM